MIQRWGFINYKVVLHHDKAGESRKWIGSGISMMDPDQYPGPAGYRPDFELRDGMMVLTSTETSDQVLADPLLKEHPPHVVEAFGLGGAFSLTFQDGDTLFLRHILGPGISVLRNETLVFAFGVIIGMPLGLGIRVSDDPRLVDMLERWIKSKRRWADIPWELWKDLHVTVSNQQAEIHLKEGKEAFLDPYYVRVERTYEPGAVMGEPTIVGIAQLSENLTKEAVIERLAPYRRR